MNAPTAVCLLFFINFIFAVDAFTDKDLWLVFKEDHGKTYKNLLEEKIRFKTFQENLIKIKNHNERYEKGEESYFLKVTPNADLSDQEFRRKLILGAQTMPTFEGLLELELFESQGNLSSVPDSLDWRSLGAVSEVKNQGHCGSCWAFSATGALEGQNAIKNQKLIALSEQQLLDCSTSYGNGGCLRGGLMNFAFEYVKDHGIESEKEYPYEGMKRKCRAVGSKSLIKVKGYKRVPKHEKDLKAAIATIGPISASLDATFFHLYGGGIFNHRLCSSTIPNHGVLLVGYGEHCGKAYWLIKNSWGSAWGERGYMRLVRDASNRCGIANGAVYPVTG